MQQLPDMHSQNCQSSVTAPQHVHTFPSVLKHVTCSSELPCFLQNNSPAATDEYSHDSSSGDQASSSGRAAVLERFIQEQCSEAVQQMADQLHTQLVQLGQPAMNLQGAQLVEQALLLGGFALSCPSPPLL